MSDYTQILYEQVGAVARVSLNRPRYYNAQSRLLREEMDAAFDRAVHDESVRVIVLAGVGDHFSSGHDLGSPEESADAKRRPYAAGLPGQYERGWDLNVENSLRWRELPKPTIAQVQGYCIFGGWIIASAMDIIVAADDAKFLPSHVQYFSMPWDLGVRKAKEILYQQRFVLAQEALDLGFVNQVVPRAELAERTMELANSIAQSDPFYTRMVKLSVNQAQDAMGFRTAVQGAYGNYLALQAAGKINGGQREPGARKRLPGVQQAFNNLQPKGETAGAAPPEVSGS